MLRPGIGKTVLLRHLACRLDPQLFPDGIIYWSVGGRSYEDVLQALFELFYTTEIPYKPTPAQVQQYVEGKQALLIFDDVDLTRQEVEKLMVEVAPRCTFNLASQKRHLLGEGKGIGLKGLPLDAALVLMQRTLGRELTFEERTAAQHLHTALSGHPLRLLQKVAQVQEKGYTLTALAQQVRTPTDADQGTVQDAEKRPEADRKMLALLALMGGKPVHAQHLAVLAGLTDAEPALLAMAQKGLVEPVGLRYRISENLMQPLQAWDLKPTLEQALEYFASWAQQQQDTPGRIEWEADALMQLLSRAVEAERWKDVLRLGQAIEGALALSARWGAWEQVLEQYLQAAKAEEDKKARAFALHQMGTRALCLNKAAEAKTRLTEAFHLRKALGDKIAAAVTQANLDLLTFPPGPSTDGSGQTDPSSGLMETIKGASVAVKGAIVGIPPLIIGGLLILMLLQIKPPADLSISSRSVSAVSLSWVDKNDAKTPFIIERRTGGGMFAVIDSVVAGATVFTDTSFVPNTRYVYRVGAQKSNGKLVYSEEYPVLTPSATPSGLTVEDLTLTTVTLRWNPNPADIKIERHNGDGAFQEIAEVVAGTTQYLDEQAAPNTRYAYRVRAFNNSGDSEFSNEASALTPPVAPNNLVVRVVSQTQLVLSWNYQGANRPLFKIERRNDGSRTFREIDTGVSRTQYTDQQVAANTGYTYRVRAFNDGGDSEPSNEMRGLTLPAAPTNLTVSDFSTTTVTLRWRDNNPNPAAFMIGRFDINGAIRVIARVAAGTRQYAHEGLLSNTTYTYWVRAFNESGNSKPSNAVRATTLRPVGLFSMTLSLDLGRDGIFVGWEGQNISGTVVLDGPAPASGVRVTLTSSNTQVAQVPSILTIREGRTQGNFTVTIAKKVSGAPVIIITATYNDVRRTVEVRVSRRID